MNHTCSILFVCYLLLTGMGSAKSAEIEVPPNEALGIKSQRALVEPEEVNNKNEKWNAVEISKPMKEAPPAPPPRKYTGAFAFDVGFIARTNDPEEQFSYMMGLQYRSSSLHPGHWEFGFDIIGDRMGSLSVGYRYIFDHDRKVRPQLKLAWVSTPPSGSGVDQLFSMANQGARLTVGLENFFREDTSFRFEGESELVGSSGVVRIKMGLIWSFEAVAGRLQE